MDVINLKREDRTIASIIASSPLNHINELNNLEILFNKIDDN